MTENQRSSMIRPAKVRRDFKARERAAVTGLGIPVILADRQGRGHRDDGAIASENLPETLKPPVRGADDKEEVRRGSPDGGGRRLIGSRPDLPIQGLSDRSPDQDA